MYGGLNNAATQTNNYGDAFMTVGGPATLSPNTNGVTYVYIVYPQGGREDWVTP